jgi:hypothetical protein
MKKFIVLSLLCFSMLVCHSCHNNRLKTNEKEFAKEIVALEAQKKESERNAPEKSANETSKEFSGSIRKKEIRSIDSQKPPIKLDILGSNSNSVKFKLSDVATSIRYIKLQTPPDTSVIYDPFFNKSSLISTISTDGEQIIFQGLFGLVRFTMQGEYREIIWKNKTGIRIFGSNVMFGDNSFYGVTPNAHASLSDGNLYYPFMDGPAGTGQFMKLKLGSKQSLSVKSQPEMPGRGTILGDTLLITNKNPFERFDWIYGIGNEAWAGINQKWNAGKTGSMLVTFNDKGDTLCKFTDYDRVVNFTKSTYRQTTEFASYHYDGLLTIKQEYNDTVFRLISPERLLPVYIIDFGKLKVNYMDGLNPDLSLSDKYMIKSIHETNNYLFIRYTQNYDAPVSREKKAVKFFNAIFDKQKRKLIHQEGFTSLPEGMINDIDGGMPFWPEFITPQNEMGTLVSGRMIKNYVKSPEFKKANISDEKRQKLLSMAAELKPTDMIVIFVK